MLRILVTILVTIWLGVMSTTVLAAEALPEDVALPDDLEGNLDLPLAVEGHSEVVAHQTGMDFLDHFTFKLSQQIYAQVNPHVTASGVDKQAQVENNRLSFLIKYQHAITAGWALQGSAQAKLYWPTDYEFDHGRSSQSIEMEQRLENFELRLNEAFISKNMDNHTLKLGRQTIVWGENEGNSILDAINTLEYRDLSIIEMEDARLNQWFLSWDYFKDNNRISSFINLNPQFNPLPRLGSPAYVPIPFPVIDPEQNKHRIEAGSRAQWSIEHTDFSLMAAYLYENQLHYETPSKPSAAIMAKQNGYWLLGASANRAIGKLLMKLDIAYSQDLLADTLITPQAPGLLPRTSSVRKNQLGATLGFDYTISNEQTLNVSVLARAFLDRTTGLTLGESMVNGELFGSWLIRYSHTFMNGNLIFSTFNRGTINADQVLTSAMLSYAIDDHWSVAGVAIGTFATKQSSAALLDNDVRLGFTVSYSQ